MKKAEMVDEVQLAEAKAWKEYESARALWGNDNEITNKRRAVWVAIDTLRESMGIGRMAIEKVIELRLL